MALPETGGCLAPRDPVTGVATGPCRTPWDATLSIAPADLTPLLVVVDVLREYPELAIALGVALRVARAWQTSLTTPEYRALHRLKRGVLPLVDRVTPGVLLLVSEKGGRDDPEYLTTMDAPVWSVFGTLVRAGGSPHLINALKRRPGEHGDRLSAAHVVWTHGDGEQTEAYLFRNADGSTDVYVHHEPSTDTPVEHLTGTQRDGDVTGVVTDALAEPDGPNAVVHHGHGVAVS